MSPRLRTVLLATAAATLLVGCDSLQRADGVFGWAAPYRIDIVQGNAVTKEQAALVRPGMTRLQVRDILGTPLIADPFHAGRWDYLFTLRRPGVAALRRTVIVEFDGERVKTVQADELPTEREFIASISRFQDVRAQRLELSSDERAALPTPTKREEPPAEPIGPVRSYPPLEPA